MSKRSFASALKWAYVGNVGDRAISGLITLILAGIVGPHDFGLVSIALVYINFVQMVLEQGFASALIQKKNLQQEHCDAVFWLNLIISISFVGVTILISGWWAKINHAPDLAHVLTALSVCIPIEGLSIVQTALVRRELDFRTLTIRSNVSAGIGGLTGLGLALTGWGVWALVAMQLARDFSSLILLWNLSRWRPRFEFSFFHLKELLRFSTHIFLGGLGTFVDMQTGSMLLGVFFGPVAVGLYRLAERLVSTVVAIATTSVQSVSLPEFSKLQDDPEQLKSSAISCIRLSSMATMPALAGMAVISGPLMAMLGPKWVPATNVLTILSVQGMIFTLSFFTSPLLAAVGKPNTSAKLEWVRAIVGVVFLTVAGFLLRNTTIDWQLSGIALAKAVPNVFFVTPVFCYLLMRVARVSIQDLLSALSSPIWVSLSIVVVISLLRIVGVPNWATPRTLVCVEAIIGGATGVGVLLMLDRQARQIAFGLVNRFGSSGLAGR
jgi:O-antigen/teichoic acid export membrane protein